MKKLVVDSGKPRGFVGLRLEERDDAIILRVTNGLGMDYASGGLIRFQVDESGRLYGVRLAYVDPIVARTAGDSNYLRLGYECED